MIVLCRPNGIVPADVCLTPLLLLLLFGGVDDDDTPGGDKAADLLPPPLDECFLLPLVDSDSLLLTPLVFDDGVVVVVVLGPNACSNRVGLTLTFLRNSFSFNV